MFKKWRGLFPLLLELEIPESFRVFKAERLTVPPYEPWVWQLRNFCRVYRMPETNNLCDMTLSCAWIIE